MPVAKIWVDALARSVHKISPSVTRRVLQRFTEVGREFVGEVVSLRDGCVLIALFLEGGAAVTNRIFMITAINYAAVYAVVDGLSKKGLVVVDRTEAGTQAALTERGLTLCKAAVT